MKLRLKNSGDEIREKIFYLAISAALLLISACSVGPDYVRPALETPAAYKETEAAKNSPVGRRRGEPKLVGDLRRPRAQFFGTASRDLKPKRRPSRSAISPSPRAGASRARGLFSDRDRRCRDNSHGDVGDVRRKHIEKQPDLHATFLTRRCLLGVGCLGPYPSHRRVERSDRSSQRGGPGSGDPERPRRIGARLFSTALAGRTKTTARQHRGRL